MTLVPGASEIMPHHARRAAPVPVPSR
jgi:hypothetical protein